MGKSKAERAAYTGALKTLDYETTIDDSLDFPSSDKKDDKPNLPGETALPKGSARRRPRTIQDQVRSHFQENWIGYLVSVFSFTSIYFIFTFNREIGILQGKVEHFEGSIQNSTNAIRDIDKKFDEKTEKVNIHLHELELRVYSRK